MADPPARTPRLAYDAPTLIRAGSAIRHRWGDAASGYVDDEVLISSPLLHSIIFTLPPAGSFVHSRANPTVFRADIVYVVLDGELVLADPQHGQVVRAAKGDALFFRRDTWHDGFNRRAEPVRVLEYFSPPPATGASSDYARSQPYLESACYADDVVIGHWPALAPALARTQRIALVRPEQRLLRLEGDVLWGLVASTEHLHVAVGELPPGGSSHARRYGGDVALHVACGRVLATTDLAGVAAEHSLGAGDTLIAPRGASLALGGAGEADATFILGVAPAYHERDATT